MKKPYIVSIVLVVIVIVVFGYAFIKNRDQQQLIQKPTNQITNPKVVTSTPVSNLPENIHFYNKSVEPIAYFDTSSWKQYADKYITFKYPTKYALSTSTAFSTPGLNISVYDPTLKPGEGVEGDIVQKGLIQIGYVKDTYNSIPKNYLDPSGVELLNKNQIAIDRQPTYVVKGWAASSAENFRLTFVNGQLFLFTSDSIDMDSAGNYLSKSDYEKVFETMLTTVKFLKPKN